MNHFFKMIYFFRSYWDLSCFQETFQNKPPLTAVTVKETNQHFSLCLIWLECWQSGSVVKTDLLDYFIFLPHRTNAPGRLCHSKRRVHTSQLPYHCLLTHNNPTIQSPGQTKSIRTAETQISTNRLCESEHSGEQKRAFCLHSAYLWHRVPDKEALIELQRDTWAESYTHTYTHKGALIKVYSLPLNFAKMLNVSLTDSGACQLIYEHPWNCLSDAWRGWLTNSGRVNKRRRPDKTQRDGDREPLGWTRKNKGHST